MPVWVVAAVKPVLPLPGPLTPIRLPPLSVKVPVGLSASGPVPAELAAMMVFWTLNVPLPSQKTPPPLLAKLALMMSFNSARGNQVGPALAFLPFYQPYD